MWGGCFTLKTAQHLADLNSSIDIDKRMYSEDITASQVYAKALNSAGIINEYDCTLIVEGLEKIRKEWSGAIFEIRIEDEDIHSANERRLRELIGEAANRLHTGRSRNDQVATDVRLWIKNNVPIMHKSLMKLIMMIVDCAKNNMDVIMPGYTHMKRAQPVRWSHFIMSYAWSLKDDADLLKVFLNRTLTLPLGSGALAGNPFPINRRAMAKELGFTDITMNSMNAVGNRDFIAELLFWCSMCGTHLSRLSEDLIIFNTEEFGFVKVSQTYSTGSSLLPQKRNPDGLELTRGIAARLIGNVTTFLTTLKGLPSTYNKDLQIDKKMLFESFDLMCQILEVMTGTIETITVDADKCNAALNVEQLMTRLTYWLVKKGLPFRQAHHIAGRMVAVAECKNVSIDKLPEEDRLNISEILGGDLSDIWNYEAAVEELNTSGGTARSSVLEQIDMLEKWLKSDDYN